MPADPDLWSCNCEKFSVCVFHAYITATELEDAKTNRSSALAHFVAWALRGLVTLTFNLVEIKW